MFCYVCGNPLPEGSLFCNECGAKQNTAVEADSMVNQTTEGPAPVPYSAQATTVKPRKKSRLPFIIGIGVAVILLIIVIAALGSDESGNGNSSAPTTTRDLAAESIKGGTLNFYPSKKLGSALAGSYPI
jgi:uncharacterized membrane protein YvbJ